MKALILAAGFGTRMAPITDTIPKPLIPVLNRPTIEYNIHFLKYFGIREIYINLHYNGEKIAKTLGDGKKYGVKIEYLRESEILGTGGAIASMEPFVKDEPFLVINSDTIFNFDLDSMIEAHLASGALATLGVLPASQQDPRAVIRVDGNRIVRMLNESFYDKLPEGNALFTGVQIVNPELLEFIPKGCFVSITSYVYKRIVKSRRHLEAFYIKGNWWDMGTPDGYLDCTFDLLNTLPLPFFDIFSGYLHTKYEDMAKKNAETSDRTKLSDFFVALGNKLNLPPVNQNPPIVIGNNCDIDRNITLGPNLIVGDGAKLTGEQALSNAVYLPGADGTKVIYGKSGRIYY